jgi:ABC-2 type transport system ATP-binding protein
MIRIRSLTKTYGSAEALRGIDLDVPKGAMVGLLGPNGAGKSTTIRILAGILRPTSGTAEIGGHDVVRDPIEVKRIMGYIPETGAVFETLTAWEYLTLVASLHGIAPDTVPGRISGFADFFELSRSDLVSKPLGAFSKGMRQKVVITAGLLHHPQVIFFDEPLNGLDANAALSVKTMITTLAREGRTILYCSHVLDVVERVCERIVIIHQGRIIADGTMDALKQMTGESSLERIFNHLTGTENLLARAEEFARILSE